MSAAREKLLSTDSFLLLDYIQSTVDILLSFSKSQPPETETHNQSQTQNNVYEEMIQRLEADVRNHIRVEQQLKIHIESLQYKVDEEKQKVGSAPADDVRSVYALRTIGRSSRPLSRD